MALLEQARVHTTWAMAAYGAPMYFWSRRRRCGCCTLCCDRRNCTSLLSRQFTSRHVGQTTGMMSYVPHAFHRDAILRTIKSLEDDDLLYVSHSNQVRCNTSRLRV